MNKLDLLTIIEYPNGAVYVTIRLDEFVGARRAMMVYAKELLEIYETKLAGELANLLNTLGGTVDWEKE